MAMNRTFRYYRLVWLKYDLPAGLSVFLVALPLCLGIAVASGAPVYAGLLSGIIGGLVVALISGSSLAVSGPAAGLTTVVSASILSLGDYRLFLLAVIAAGLFQVVLGLMKLGTIANYFPSSVIKGMLAAIGVILISKQIPLALGYSQAIFQTDVFLDMFSTSDIGKRTLLVSDQLHPGALVIALVSLVVLIIFQLPGTRRWQLIPPPLLVVLLAVSLNSLFVTFASGLALKPSQLVQVPANVFSDIRLPELSLLFSDIRIWKEGLVIGLLASLETLLCIEAIDKLDRKNRITPVNRELIAQGVGNISCGLLGAIPLTAVVVRGAANVQAGGRTKLSAFTHGLFLLSAVLLVPFMLNRIPFAALAAILLVTGYNLTRPKLYRDMWALGLKQFLPFIITIIIILLTDLLVGVSLGLLISVYFIVQNNFRAEYKISRSHHMGIDTYLIRLNTNVTFLNKVNLRKALDKIPEYSVLIIDGSECDFIDYDILEIISEYHNKAHDRHIDLQLKGIERVKSTAVH